MTKQFLVVYFFLFTLTVYSQGPPPEELAPSDEQKVLIDEIFKLNLEESRFNYYVAQKITETTEEKSWTPDKANKVLSSIHFSDFVESMYSFYAAYSVDELKQIMEVIKLLNRNGDRMMIVNSAIQSNLDLFIKRYLK